MVRVSVSETYDLSTKVGKMSLIGIHTPSLDIIKKSYGGLIENFKFMRFVKCDVRLACASVLPADPLQVGVASGKIAPQDMFNPILYKAVSNQAMDTFTLRMQGLRTGTGGRDPTLFEGESIDKTDVVTGDSNNEFNVYYTLLSNRKGWKIAHPQAGLMMASLRPLVYEKLYNVADSPSFTPGARTIESGASSEDYVDVIGVSSSKATELSEHVRGVRSFRGRPHRMPAIPTTIFDVPNLTENKDMAFTGQESLLGTGGESRNIMTYCGLILMPPAELNKFYYRLVVRWYVDFLGLRSANDILHFPTMDTNASVYYGCDYTIGSKDTQMAMVDADNADISKIMEGI